MSDDIFIARDMIIVINVIFNRLRDIKYCLNEEFDLSRYRKKVTWKESAQITQINTEFV